MKAYTTRVGGGPFPTELDDEIGAQLAKRGNEFGSVTGRPRRCGWLDIPLLRRSAQLSGVDGLCITKLDVLDGLDAIRVCTGYRIDGQATAPRADRRRRGRALRAGVRDAARLEGQHGRGDDLRRVAARARAPT